jgi:NodT family efflux transporter outer membrane factor (OMF) lipoprotein
MRWRWIVPPILGLVAGCAVGPNYDPPATDAPPAFAAGAAKAPANPPVDPARWWESFNDAELTSLVRRAVAANLDLQVAVARLQEAEANEAGVLGTLLPAADATGAAGSGTGSDLTRGRLEPPLASADNTNGARIKRAGGFAGGMEIDLFGQLRRELEAAKYDAQAAAAARNDVTVTVIAQVAKTYFDMRGLEMRLAALGHDVDAAQQGLKYVQARYDRGLTNELDLTLAQRELATLQVDVAPLAAQIASARYSIAVLVGQYPETIDRELDAPGMIPALPASVGIGLPVELLRRRPDIREAERELAASNARIGVAIGDLFPHIDLTGAVGVQRPSPPGPGLSHEIWAVGPSATWSLLDFGTLDSLVEVADFRHKESLLNYKRTVIEAVQQVDSAAQVYAAEQESLEHLSTALAASQLSVTLATQRYEHGLTDYLNVLDAQRQEFDLESQYAATSQTAADALVALYRGLGGGWEDYQALPPIQQPLPAVVAAFRRVFDSGAAQ